ncbi:Ldh family oxidoreductase [Pelosinus propionicus]|uniref:Malate/lactate/ureidoglycolate dehydrogenase, LDH2 family n=1 Tax=Pelosinus propionicus DSM 13327 TaxID=1123291 RepID=A0A1I4PVE3_9FIRM|nr:Ldh family oxidoreductase [Pelosinus propionicus]SFM31777.1 Malate/lactate/ureidoglycolate dehydrogenase, LDH2 family [Pelosinus propionicus DSM 13327]
MRIKVNTLREFYITVLEAVNTPPEEAGITADALIDADLHGLETHGALRIPSYIKAAKAGRLEAFHSPFIEWNKKAVSLVDGNNGWGQPGAVMAVREVINNAKSHGVGAIAIKNTNHIGACGYYARMIAENGLAGFVTTNSSPNMPPWGGKEPVLGTNPICFSAPSPGGNLVVADMATSVVAKGKILLAAEKGEPIPEGWALDKNGRTTTDPKKALEGSLLPVGGPKGYGLALFADIFSGVLSGANFGNKICGMLGTSAEPVGVGAFMWAIDIELFGAEGFYERIGELISMVTGSKLSDGIQRIYLPGEIENQTAKERSLIGVSISTSIVKNLNTVAQELGVSPLLTD